MGTSGRQSAGVSGLLLATAGLLVVLSGCVSFVDENNPQRAEVRFHNDTEFNVIRWSVPTRLSLEEFVAERGVPQLSTIQPGDSVLHWWRPQGDNTLEDRPLCDEFTTHYFFRHVDPDYEYERVTLDEPPRLEDLIVIETLEGPCWEDDRDEFRITGTGS